MMEDFVIFYSTDAKTGVVTETKHYLTPEEKTEYAKANVPTVVTMRQARLALLQFGVLDIVEEAISQGTRADQITWEYATEVRRTDPLVMNMAAALNLTQAQIDELFTTASAL
jgi:hypothetical protein